MSKDTSFSQLAAEHSDFIKSLYETDDNPPQTLLDILNGPPVIKQSFKKSKELVDLNVINLDVFPKLDAKPCSLFAKALAAKRKISKDRILKLETIRKELIKHIYWH